MKEFGLDKHHRGNNSSKFAEIQIDTPGSFLVRLILSTP